MSKIVFTGHSVPKGTDYGGVTAADTFVRKIGIANGYAPADILNKCVGSDTSAGMLARFQADVIAHNPSVCVFAGCLANDWAAGVPVATSKSNVATMIDLAQAAGIKCVVFTDVLHRGDVTVFNTYFPYIEAAKEVAAAKGCRYIDLYARFCQAVMVGEFLPLYVDNIHLTIAGHQFVADHAAKSFYAGFFVADPVVDPVPLPDESSELLLAVVDYVLMTGNAALTAEVFAAKQAAQDA